MVFSVSSVIFVFIYIAFSKTAFIRFQVRGLMESIKSEKDKILRIENERDVSKCKSCAQYLYSLKVIYVILSLFGLCC